MKKRTLAVLLSVLLVVSAIIVLAACKDTEYTVRFLEANGKKLDEVTTVGGKATATSKATTKPGYTFEAWYKTVTADENDNYVFSDEVDLEKYVFTEDTDLYAKWKRNLTKGEESGYCVIGKISGLSEEWTNGGFDPEAAMNEPKAQLSYPGDPVNLYTITLDVKALDSFKIKTSRADWNGEINGLSPLLDKGSVSVKSGVNLPEGVSKASDLFTYTYGIDNNVSPKCDMNITINFYYNANDSYADLIVNSIDGELVKSVEDVGYVIAGSMNKVGDDWKDHFTAAEIKADSTLAQYVFTADAEKKSFTTTVVLHRNDNFQIKVNESGWSRGQYGADAINSVTYAEDLDDAKKPDADASVAFSTSGNIVAKYDLTAIITITADGGETSTNGKIAIVITEIDPTEPTPVTELGMAVVGGGTLGWNYPYSNVMAYDEATQTFSKEGVVIPLGTEFKVKVNDDDKWAGGEWGRGVLTNVTLAQGVTLPEGMTEAIELFGGDATNATGNISALRGMTITIKLVNFDADAKTGELEIVVTSIEELPEVTHQMFIVGTVGGNGDVFNNDFDKAAYVMEKEKDSDIWYVKITVTTADFASWAENGTKAAIKVKNNIGGKDYGINDASGTAGTNNIYLGEGDYIVTYNQTTNVVSYEKVATAGPEAKIGETEYATLEAAITAAQANDVIVLQKNVTLNKQIAISKSIVLDMNGKTISNTENLYNSDNGSYGFFALVSGGNLTVRGNGKMLAKENDGYAISVWDKDSKLVIEDGEYAGNVVCIYVYDGTAEIKGGKFYIQQLSDGTGLAPYRYTLNLKDKNHTAGTAKFIVTGGEFVNFDPSNSASEAPEANFVSAGYTVTSKTEGTDTIYTVAASTQD